jgi:apolipoprotein N-acyltransferase
VMVPAIGNLSLVIIPRISGVLAGSHARLSSDLALVALGAIFYTLASPPFDWYVLGWLTLTPLFIALRDANFRRAAMYGLLYGVLICAGVAHWMYSAISTYFVAVFPLNVLLTVLSYVVFVGIYTAATAGGWSLLMRRSGHRVRWLAIPALWVVCEYARSSFLSGFSWDCWATRSIVFRPLFR